MKLFGIPGNSSARCLKCVHFHAESEKVLSKFLLPVFKVSQELSVWNLSI